MLSVLRAQYYPSYKAAVFEHTGLPQGNESMHITVARNLEFYNSAAKFAHSRDTDVIVFPEYGIVPYSSRETIRPYLESIPDPGYYISTPCSEREEYLNRTILYTLSCIAKNNSMYVIANLGEIQNCSILPHCPSDGEYHFNTNVVFDRNGTILVRYRKEHPYFEPGMDIPRVTQDPIFKTDFGTFATYTCFDIIFHRMSKIAHLPSIDGIFFPTMWIDAAPQFISVAYFQAWAIGNNITLLAANRQVPSKGILGSGIFHGRRGVLAYKYNPDLIPTVMVARIPKRGYLPVSPDASFARFSANGSTIWTDENITISQNSGSFTNGTFLFSESMLENYTFKKLNKSFGFIEACNNGMCCSIKYSTKGLKEQFYLGVFNGTYNISNRYFWCEEDCVLVRCDASGKIPCGSFPFASTTLFDHLLMRANFSSELVYPSVVQSTVKLVHPRTWYFDAITRSERYIFLKSKSGINLTMVGLKGRCYNKDPPFRG
ncbi:pantetheinase [Nephila pilipes]|uniref:Pantetheinase n=1 Tax=Nephila pilipes TaxID=299642 RepID=A0A8X6N4H6_NEPPI|nr:pantetheinase [Nephila pilipes]